MSTDLVAHTPGALSLATGQNFWSAEQRAALAAMGVEDDCSNAELAVYQHVCQASGLDPFSGQIHLIGRYDSRVGRKVYRPQTGIDGLRLTAQRTGEFAGRVGPQWCGEDGTWRDVWLSKDNPAAARVGVRRTGHPEPTWAVATWDEYAQTKDGKPLGMWRNMPANQLAKCAEAQALRVVFPRETVGLKIAEEMARSDHAAEVESQQAMADAMSRQAATSHERLTAQLTGPQAQKAERSTEMDRSEWVLPADDAQARQNAWFEQDDLAADSDGLPHTDRARFAELLAAIRDSADKKALTEARSDARAALKANNITARAHAICVTAAEKRVGELEAEPDVDPDTGLLVPEGVGLPPEDAA